MINTASDYLTVRPKNGYAGGEEEFSNAQEYTGTENYTETQDFEGMHNYGTAQAYNENQNYSENQNYMDAQNCAMPRRGMDTRQSLLARVNETGFAVDDANLYLDTHPCDQAALAYFQHASAMYRDAVNAYSAQFGPLMAVDSTDINYWSWISDPWPWEGGLN